MFMRALISTDDDHRESKERWKVESYKQCLDYEKLINYRFGRGKGIDYREDRWKVESYIELMPSLPP